MLVFELIECLASSLLVSVFFFQDGLSENVHSDKIEEENEVNDPDAAGKEISGCS